MSKPTTTAHRRRTPAVEAVQVTEKNIDQTATWLRGLADVADVTKTDLVRPQIDGQDTPLDEVPALLITNAAGHTMVAHLGDHVLAMGHPDGKTVETRRPADFTAEFEPTA